MPATTREEVEAQSTKDRLWESLDNAYSQQREDSDKSYDKAYGQADRQLLSRGMQRSSFGAQTLANINQQKLEARNNSWKNQIADYQNRLTEQENTDWTHAFQEKQFGEGVRQFNLNYDLNKSNTEWQQDFQERQFAEGKRQNDKDDASSYVMSILQSGSMPSDDLLAQAGLSRADAELMRAFYAQQLAAANAGSSGSSRGGSNPGTNNNSSGNETSVWGDIMAWLMGNDTPPAAQQQEEKKLPAKAPTKNTNLQKQNNKFSVALER